MERSSANSIIGNYKHKFKTIHGRDAALSDDQIFEVIEAVGVMPSGEEQDEATLEDMLSAEVEIGKS